MVSRPARARHVQRRRRPARSRAGHLGRSDYRAGRGSGQEGSRGSRDSILALDPRAVRAVIICIAPEAKPGRTQPRGPREGGDRDARGFGSRSLYAEVIEKLRVRGRSVSKGELQRFQRNSHAMGQASAQGGGHVSVGRTDCTPGRQETGSAARDHHHRKIGARGAHPSHDAARPWRRGDHAAPSVERPARQRA